MSAPKATRRRETVLSAETAAIREQRIQSDLAFYGKAKYDKSLYSDDVATAAKMFLVAFRNSLVCSHEDAAETMSGASSEASKVGKGGSPKKSKEKAAEKEKSKTADKARGTKRPAAGKTGGAKKKKPKVAAEGSDSSTAKVRTGGNSSIPPGSEVACRVKEGGQATWILATVRRYVSESKKYEVMDSGEEEGRKTHMVFKKHIKVLSKTAENIEIGTRVMAIYVETTTFYSAIVRGRKSGNYLLAFDDEEEEEAGLAKEVRRQHVFIE